jgi:hypothetical protein
MFTANFLMTMVNKRFEVKIDTNLWAAGKADETMPGSKIE